MCLRLWCLAMHICNFYFIAKQRGYHRRLVLILGFCCYILVMYAWIKPQVSSSNLANASLRNQLCPTSFKEQCVNIITNNHAYKPLSVRTSSQKPPEKYTCYTFPTGTERNGIKWLSFPSIGKVNDYKGNFVQFISPILNMHYLEQVYWKQGNNPVQWIEMSFAGWMGYNHYVIPQQGYKIKLNPTNEEQLFLFAPDIKPDPTLPINLIAKISPRSPGPDNENWLGYFGEATVRPYDAFAEVIDNLWYIQHQDWTLVRLSVVPGSPWIGVAYPGFREPTLKYGDMVIVKCFNDAQFTWNTEAPAGESFIKEYPTKFTFTEKLDYIPVYVEFTGTEIPKEAAVYVEGICKGAAVVGGNSVEIPAYILDDIGYNAELELRVYYDNKAAYNSIPQYQLWNMEAGQYENSSLILSERKPYYMLKMDGGSVNDTPAPKLYLGSYPNPFNPDTTLRFTLPANADISLDIYNVKGQKVRSLKSGNYSAGTHTCLWDAKDDGGSRVASGLYFAMLSYQGKQLSRKLLLMK